MSVRSWLAGLCLAVLLGTCGGTAHAVDRPRFDPASTVVEVGVDGTAVVRFTEVGLQPGDSVDVAVTVTVTIETTCVDQSSGQVLFQTTSSASAGTIASHKADDVGRIVGVESLTARPGSVDVTGMPCEVRRKTTASATVTDQDHDIRITVVP
jgi:hypothetical protein